MSDESPRHTVQDGIPNPNYDPEYGKRRADVFAPTLRMDVDDDKLSVFEAAGLTVETATAQMTEFFRSANVNDGIRFFADSITVVSTGQTLKNFQAVVAAIFEIDGTYHLKLTTGDVVEVKFYRD